MKIIFSRKGWDSTYGGRPSPVFPDSTLQSLPIPCVPGSPVTIAIRCPNLQRQGYANLAAFHASYHPTAGPHAHLDPDLDRGAFARSLGWRPCFGQAGNAASHLDKQGVGVGDVFLFYGWFDDVACSDGKWRRAGNDRFVIWGWLQVGQIVTPPTSPPWLSYHPHVKHHGSAGYAKNRIYVAAPKLVLPGQRTFLPGGGVFRAEVPTRCLTTHLGKRGLRPDKLPPWLTPTRFRQEHVWDTNAHPDSLAYVASFFG